MVLPSLSKAQANSETRNYERLKLLFDKLKPTRKDRLGNTRWDEIAIYDRGQSEGKQIISVALAPGGVPNEAEYFYIFLGSGGGMTAKISPEGHVDSREDREDFEALLMKAIEQGLQHPEEVQKEVRALQAAEEAELKRIVLVNSRWEAGEYERREAALKRLEDQNEQLPGLEKENVSLAVFLKVINILYDSFGSKLNEVKTLDDVRGREGADSIKDLFSRSASNEDSLLNVDRYRRLRDNEIEFQESYTLHLINDRQDDGRVRFILRDRYSPKVFHEEKRFRFYEVLVQEGVPVLYDDPEEGKENNQLSRLYLGDYNVLHELDIAKRPLFPVRSETRLIVSKESVMKTAEEMTAGLFRIVDIWTSAFYDLRHGRPAYAASGRHPEGAVSDRRIAEILSAKGGPAFGGRLKTAQNDGSVVNVGATRGVDQSLEGRVIDSPLQISEAEREALVAWYAAFAEGSATVVLPAEILPPEFAAMFVSDFVVGARHASPVKFRIIFAGTDEHAQWLNTAMMSRETLEGLSPTEKAAVAKIFDVQLLNQTDAVERLHGQNVAVGYSTSVGATRGVDQTFEGRVNDSPLRAKQKIFMLEDMKNISAHDRPRYLHRITQFMIAAAPLTPEEVKQLLRELNIQTDGEGLPFLSSESLLHEKTAEIFNQLATARSA